MCLQCIFLPKRIILRINRLFFRWLWSIFFGFDLATIATTIANKKICWWMRNFKSTCLFIYFEYFFYLELLSVLWLNISRPRHFYAIGQFLKIIIHKYIHEYICGQLFFESDRERFSKCWKNSKLYPIKKIIKKI